MQIFSEIPKKKKNNGEENEWIKRGKPCAKHYSSSIHS